MVHRTKYPLAAVLWALKHFPKRMAIGYDIGCVFGGTVKRAPITKDLAEKQELFICASATFLVQCLRRYLSIPLGMGAFHGYAHARDCQIDFHPRVADLGMGLEDFEGCERLFSKTNRFAGMSR